MFSIIFVSTIALLAALYISESVTDYQNLALAVGLSIFTFIVLMSLGIYGINSLSQSISQKTLEPHRYEMVVLDNGCLAMDIGKEIFYKIRDDNFEVQLRKKVKYQKVEILNSDNDNNYVVELEAGSSLAWLIFPTSEYNKITIYKGKSFPSDKVRSKL